MATFTFDVKKTVGTFSAAGETGDPLDVEYLDAPKSIQFSGMQIGTFTDATMQLQGTLDGAVWQNVGAQVTLNSIVPFEGLYAKLRILTVAHGGTCVPVVTLHGHRHAGG